MRLRNSCVCQLALVAAALPFVARMGPGSGRWPGVVATSLCAWAMGIQNSTVRSLAVPDLTTTVLTMTITGIAVDRWSDRPGVTVRRLLSVLLMAVGALVGALLVLHVDLVTPLSVVVALLAGVALACHRGVRRRSGWATGTRPA